MTKLCLWCRKEYAPRSPASFLCSNACKLARFKELRNPGRAARVAEKASVALAKKAEKAAKKEARISARALLATARAEFRKACYLCGSPVDSSRNRLCGTCRAQNKKSQKRASRKAGKMARRTALVETFDDIEILERDGWRCYLCGCDTPKRLRGTFDGSAPELEHVKPISRGGAHSRENTRCACRDCNLLKGSMTLEEFMHNYGAGVVADFQRLAA